MARGAIGALALSVVFWASAPLAETAAQEAPRGDWAVPAEVVAVFSATQAWIVDQGDGAARAIGWRAANRQSVAPTPVQAGGLDLGPGAVDPLQPGLSLDRTDAWRAMGDGGVETLRLTTASPLRRADGAPLPPVGPEPALAEAQAYNLRYDYRWPAARTTTASGWQVDLTPHAGVGHGSRGAQAQAGATLRLGRDLDGMVPRGSDRFGGQGRWYLFAAGEGRAVGYNFARNRDGGFDRSGMSHDRGAFLGDATVGVAWRKGPMQASVGLTYREVEAEGLRLGRRDDDGVDEGLVAFQLSIRPGR